MNYELAKQLKEAGFPQPNANNSDGLNGYKGTSHQGKWLTIINGYWFIDGVYIPTLSELIEACGDEFAYLKRYWPSKIWEAGCDTFEQQDSSPEEAVANLWLALNKK